MFNISSLSRVFSGSVAGNSKMSGLKKMVGIKSKPKPLGFDHIGGHFSSPAQIPQDAESFANYVQRASITRIVRKDPNGRRFFGNGVSGNFDINKIVSADRRPPTPNTLGAIPKSLRKPVGSDSPRMSATAYPKPQDDPFSLYDFYSSQYNHSDEFLNKHFGETA